MIQVQCLINHNKYLLHNDPWVSKMFTQMQWNLAYLGPSQASIGGEACLSTVFRISLITKIPILDSI
jgi:hypothetical protein